jgi:hypothetical protein
LVGSARHGAILILLRILLGFVALGYGTYSLISAARAGSLLGE